MMKRVLLVLLGSLALCSPLVAQHATPWLDAPYKFALYRPEVFSTVDSSTLIERLPVRSFLDGTRFSVSSELGRMGTAPIDLPSMAYVSGAEVQHITVRRSDGKDFGTDGKDSAGEMSISQSNPLYYGGEMGIFYGRWSGKNGSDVFGSYIQGGVGTDKFQINVGAAYQEWNLHIPHGRH
jgi:hypothetical protein